MTHTRNVRRHGDIYLVTTDPLPGELVAQVGLAENATEADDPNGILTLVDDLPDGTGVRLGVSGDVAVTPFDGVLFAQPLRDPALRKHPPEEAPLGNFSRYLPSGWLGIRVLEDWSVKAAPSNSIAWVGMFSGPPMTARYGVIIGSLNDLANENRTVFQVLNDFVWRPLVTSTSSDDLQSGAMTVIGHNAGWVWQYGLAVVPWDHHNRVDQRAVQFTGDQFTIAAGDVPYLAWGVYQPVSGPGGEITIAPMAALQSYHRSAFANRSI